MEAIKYKVLDSSGKEAGTIDLDPEVFGAPVNEYITHDAVCWQLKKKRAGTHSVLTKGEMRGGNKKPWRQKGTGRARAGSNTSPVWVGGGIAHGPKPHDYVTRVSKRARRQAMLSVLSDKVNLQRLVVLNSLQVDSGKTRDMKAIFKNIGVKGNAALVFTGNNKAMQQSKEFLATRNLAGVEAMPVEGLNPFDLMRLNYLVLTVDGISALQGMLKARMSN